MTLGPPYSIIVFLGAYKVCQAIFDTYDKLLPSVDFDNDKHSPAETLRGSLWRGRDCKDFDGK